jgi:hypothetical protein
MAVIIFYYLMALGAFKPLPQLANFSQWFALYSLGTDHTEITVSNNSSIAASISVVAITCILNRCLATAVFSGSTITPLRCHVRILLILDNCVEVIVRIKWGNKFLLT